MKKIIMIIFTLLAASAVAQYRLTSINFASHSEVISKYEMVPSRQPLDNQIGIDIIIKMV